MGRRPLVFAPWGHLLPRKRQHHQAGRSAARVREFLPRGNLVSAPIGISTETYLDFVRIDGIRTEA